MAEPTFDLIWLQRLTGGTEVLKRNIPASEALQTLLLEERRDLGAGGTVFLRPSSEDPAQRIAELEAERTRLLIVAYEAYELSMHVGEFETIVDPFPIEALDRALLHAFGDTYTNFAAIGGKIAEALGGYEAALAARRAAAPPFSAMPDSTAETSEAGPGARDPTASTDEAGL